MYSRKIHSDAITHLKPTIHISVRAKARVLVSSPVVRLPKYAGLLEPPARLTVPGSPRSTWPRLMQVQFSHFPPRTSSRHEARSM